ncbi:glycosyltransferase [Candidatus Saccharibacteria bacterium]|nr:glycosyltransferase [Candidatus Saccharibacteria bacterium]
MKNPKISIIIPVYNAEKYLAECLESAKKQTLKEIEIICVNDGSTDKSLEIIKKMSLDDKRFVIIDQKNQGVIAARKAGYRKATGEYIIWVDNDDILELDMCDQLYNAAKEHDSDIVICNYRLYPKDRNTIKKKISYKSYSGEVDWEFMLKNSGTPWNKISRRSFLAKNKVETLYDNLGEATFGVLLGFADRVATIDTPLYNYRVGHTSASNSYTNIEWYDCAVKWVGEQYKYSKVYGFSKGLQDYFLYSYLYYNLVLMTVAAKNHDRKRYDKARKVLKNKPIFQKKNRAYLKAHLSFPRRVFFRFCILPNYYLACRVSRIVLR